MDLAERANSDGECFPGQESIAHDLEMSKSTVIRAILDLEHAGFLSVHRRSWPDTKRRRTSRYRLHVEPSVTVTPGDGEVEPSVTVTPGKLTPPKCHPDTGPSVTLTPGPSVTLTPDEPEALNRKHESKNPDAREKAKQKQTRGEEAVAKYLAGQNLTDELLEVHVELTTLVLDVCVKDVEPIEAAELVAHCLKYLEPDDLEAIVVQAEDLPGRPEYPSAILALVQTAAERNNVNIPYLRLRRRRTS